jgi:hypothetical protein
MLTFATQSNVLFEKEVKKQLKMFAKPETSYIAGVSIYIIAERKNSALRQTNYLEC